MVSGMSGLIGLTVIQQMIEQLHAKIDWGGERERENVKAGNMMEIYVMEQVYNSATALILKAVKVSGKTNSYFVSAAMLFNNSCTVFFLG